MDFKNRLEEEMHKAAKAQNKARLSALRLIKNIVHNREIDAHRELEEAEVLQALASMIKQRRESIEQFAKGGRADLVSKEEAEIAVIEEFMPQQLSAAEVAYEIEQAIGAVGALGPKDMGKVMKLLAPRLAGKADTRAVSEMVKAKLAELAQS